MIERSYLETSEQNLFVKEDRGLNRWARVLEAWRRDVESFLYDSVDLPVDEDFWVSYRITTWMSGVQTLVASNPILPEVIGARRITVYFTKE